jgi:hypothetical protein
MRKLVALLVASLVFGCSSNAPSGESPKQEPAPQIAEAPPQAPASDPEKIEAAPVPEPETEREPPGEGVLGAPHEYLVDQTVEIVWADGTGRKDAHRGWKMIVEPREGGLRIRQVAGTREPAPSPFDVQWDVAARELSLELDDKGRLVSVAGRDAFHDALLGTPEGAEMADREQYERIWDLNEGLFARAFRMVFAPFVGVELSHDGTPLTSNEDGVKRVTSAEPLDGADAGRLRFRHEIEGPAAKTTVDKGMYFDIAEMDFDVYRLDGVTGRWQIELIADAKTLAPTRATITMELSQTKDGTTRRTSSVTTMQFR